MVGCADRLQTESHLKNSDRRRRRFHRISMERSSMSPVVGGRQADPCFSVEAAKDPQHQRYYGLGIRSWPVVFVSGNSHSTRPTVRPGCRRQANSSHRYRAGSLRHECPFRTRRGAEGFQVQDIAWPRRATGLVPVSRKPGTGLELFDVYGTCVSGH
jgi:hypothetical protein